MVQPVCVPWQHIKKQFSSIILNWASPNLPCPENQSILLLSLLLGKLKRKSMAHRPDLHLRLRKRKEAPSAPSMSPSLVTPVTTSPTLCLLKPMKKVPLINYRKWHELTTLLSPWFLGLEWGEGGRMDSYPPSSSERKQNTAILPRTFLVSRLWKAPDDLCFLRDCEFLNFVLWKILIWLLLSVT